MVLLDGVGTAGYPLDCREPSFFKKKKKIFCIYLAVLGFCGGTQISLDLTVVACGI